MLSNTIIILSRGGFLTVYPIPGKIPIPKIKIPNPGNGKLETKKIANSGYFTKNPGYFRKSRKNPDGHTIVKAQIF